MSIDRYDIGAEGSDVAYLEIVKDNDDGDWYKTEDVDKHFTGITDVLSQIAENYARICDNYADKEKRIKELEAAIKKHKKQRDTDWLELKVATDGDNKLWTVLEE